METKVDISEISFIQKGKGKDLLFLHGYLSSKEAFRAQIEYFSRFFRVTALDFIGFGKSAPLKQPFSVADYAEWTRQAMAILQVQMPHVIAHSFGCRVAVKMAALAAVSQRKPAFDKMILTGAAGVVLRRGFLYHAKVSAYRATRKIAPRFAEKRFGSKEYRALSPIMKESYKKIVNEDLRECARKTPNEVLIIQGESDKTTPLKEAQAYLQAFKRGSLQVMQGGHFAFAERPTVFNMLVEEFLYG